MPVTIFYIVVRLSQISPDEGGEPIGDPEVLSFKSDPDETPRSSELGDLSKKRDARTASADMTDPATTQWRPSTLSNPQPLNNPIQIGRVDQVA